MLVIFAAICVAAAAISFVTQALFAVFDFVSPTEALRSDKMIL